MFDLDLRFFKVLCAVDMEKQGALSHHTTFTVESYPATVYQDVLLVKREYVLNLVLPVSPFAPIDQV